MVLSNDYAIQEQRWSAFLYECGSSLGDPVEEVTPSFFDLREFFLLDLGVLGLCYSISVLENVFRITSLCSYQSFSRLSTIF
jgi:hypothetical protein